MEKPLVSQPMWGIITDLHSTSTLCGWAPSLIHLVNKQALAQFPKAQCLLLFLYLQSSHCLPYAQKCICILQMGNVNHRFRTHLLLHYTTIHKINATVVTVFHLFLWLLFFFSYFFEVWDGELTGYNSQKRQDRKTQLNTGTHMTDPAGKYFFNLV